MLRPSAEMCDSPGEPSDWMKVMGAWLLGAALLELERSGKLIVTWCERKTENGTFKKLLDHF